MSSKKRKNKVREQIKTHKKTFIIYVILRVLVLVMFVLQLVEGNYENAFLCILTLVLFILPSILEMRLNVRLPDTLEATILIFIFTSQILGTIQNFYGLFKNFDNILHTLNGFLCAAIGFSIVDILNRTEKLHLNLSPIFVAIVGFTFSMTIGILWEFSEYAVDKVFHSDSQKDELVTSINSTYFNDDNETETIDNIVETVIVTTSGNVIVEGGYLDIGLNDTMEDLFVNFVGALVFCIFGYIYIKTRKESKVVKGFMVEFRG